MNAREGGPEGKPHEIAVLEHPNERVARCEDDGARADIAATRLAGQLLPHPSSPQSHWLHAEGAWHASGRASKSTESLPQHLAPA